MVIGSPAQLPSPSFPLNLLLLPFFYCFSDTLPYRCPRSSFHDDLGHRLHTDLAGAPDMTPAARRVDQILNDAPSAMGLLARVATARKVAHIIAPLCADVAPQADILRPGCCDLRDGVLRINVRSSTQSTKLRQAVPRLLAVLQARGVEVSEIRVGVQPSSVRHVSPGDRVKSHGDIQGTGSAPLRTGTYLSVASANSRKLALTLPDSPLRSAVCGLASAIDSRLARMRESGQTFD
jgi:hypothetical protein